MRNWLDTQRRLGRSFGAHPDSPDGRDFDWGFAGLPHPGSPEGRDFDWGDLDAPHPGSPYGHHCNWAIEIKIGVADDLPANDPEIEALNLSDTARKAAYALKKKHPSVKFTSGRRDKAAQASAMASNVVLKGQRKWIEKTYATSAARKALQKWVDDNPDKTTKDDVAQGLKAEMDKLTDAQLALLSKHLSGDAFDVQPVEKDAAAIKSTMKTLPGNSWFTDKESGLVRWHVQF